MVEGELRPSGSDRWRCCPLGATIGDSATIRHGMVSDYRATIQRLLRGKSRTEVFPNFPKTFQKPDQNFFKTVRKIERFFCAAGEGLPRAHGLGAGWLGRLGDGRQPRGGAIHAADGNPRDAEDAHGGRGRRSRTRTAGGFTSGRAPPAAGVVRLRSWLPPTVGCGSGSPPLLLMLPCRCRCGPAGCVAVAVRSPLQCRCGTCTRSLWRFYGVG